MISDRDYDVCMCGHIRAEHEGDGDGNGPCAQRVRNEVPDQVGESHFDPCGCRSFVQRDDRRSDSAEGNARKRTP